MLIIKNVLRNFSQNSVEMFDLTVNDGQWKMDSSIPKVSGRVRVA